MFEDNTSGDEVREWLVEHLRSGDVYHTGSGHHSEVQIAWRRLHVGKKCLRCGPCHVLPASPRVISYSSTPWSHNRHDWKNGTCVILVVNLTRSANLPTGLYILLALISSFYLFFFYYEQSYLSIYWTNFHDLSTKWKVFAWIFLTRSSFSDSSRDVAIATNFVSQAKRKPCAIFAIFITYESVLGVDDRSEFFFNISREVSRSISGSAGLIFTIFAPYGRYSIADDQSDLFFQ